MYRYDDQVGQQYLVLEDAGTRGHAIFQDQDLHIDIDDPMIDETMPDITLPISGSTDPFTANPDLEQTLRRILDKHMELAWQEIRLAIQRAIDKPRG